VADPVVRRCRESRHGSNPSPLVVLKVTPSMMAVGERTLEPPRSPSSNTVVVFRGFGSLELVAAAVAVALACSLDHVQLVDRERGTAASPTAM